VILNPVDDELGFVALVERPVELDRRSGGAVSPQRLAEPRRIVGDDGVGRIQDRGRRAVILLEAHYLRAGIVLLEAVEIFDPRTAPAVDRLVVVADDERRAGRAREEAHPAVLDGVRVLKLVDEHVLKPVLVLALQLEVVAQELEAPQQQLAEIDDRRRRAGPLVALVKIDHLPAACVAFVAQILRS
jgi:hypothetical protein